MASAKGITRAGAVYDQVKEEIMAGAFQPGQRLRFVELAERFAVSQSVIREALTRLAGEELVVALPQQGFRVITLSAKDLDELTEARCGIESLVLRYSIERGDVLWESALVAAHHHLASTPTLTAKGDQNPQWFDVHERFHEALLNGCDNQRLLGVALAGREAATLYRRWALPVGHDVDRDVETEHRGLLDAALARDGERAAKLLTEHIERTTAALRPFADEDAESVFKGRPMRTSGP